MVQHCVSREAGRIYYSVVVKTGLRLVSPAQTSAIVVVSAEVENTVNSG